MKLSLMKRTKGLLDEVSDASSSFLGDDHDDFEAQAIPRHKANDEETLETIFQDIHRKMSKGNSLAGLNLVDQFYGAINSIFKVETGSWRVYFVKLVRTLNDFSHSYFRLREYEKSRELLEKSETLLKLHKGIPEKEELQVLTLNNYACLCKKIRKPTRGIAFLKKAIRILERNGEIPKGLTFLNMCSLLSTTEE